MTPTLNAMDNNGEAFATVLVLAVDFYNASLSETAQTIRSSSATNSNIGGAMIFSHTQGLDIQASDINSPTLRAGGAGMAVVYPIDDAREIEKHQNGLGIGADGAPAYTLDRSQAPAVAYDEFNDSISDIHHTLRAGTKQSTGVMNKSVVRRLTPKECERLQGFPDDWTADQADSNRYKQCGNAVAVPVVQWIVNRMVGND